MLTRDEDEHLKHLLFARLEIYGRNIKPSKCIFGIQHIRKSSAAIVEQSSAPKSHNTPNLFSATIQRSPNEH
uniref:Uncharacterized protein n=1 Tax=Glossina morsitans morsitans TaxID=37546 RepID=A0A1B0GC09_GLOMM